MAVAITDNFKIYFTLLFILALFLLFFGNQNLYLEPKQIITTIPFPDQVNICLPDAK
jgi:hypothetical protein